MAIELTGFFVSLLLKKVRGRGRGTYLRGVLVWFFGQGVGHLFRGGRLIEHSHFFKEIGYFLWHQCTLWYGTFVNCPFVKSTEFNVLYWCLVTTPRGLCCIICFPSHMVGTVLTSMTTSVGSILVMFIPTTVMKGTSIQAMYLLFSEFGWFSCAVTSLLCNGNSYTNFLQQHNNTV